MAYDFIKNQKIIFICISLKSNLPLVYTYFDSSFLNNVTDPAKRRDRTADTSIENGTV